MCLLLYLPSDYGNIDSLNEYIETVAYFESLIREFDVRNFCIIGNFNCHIDSRFYPILKKFANDNSLMWSDVFRPNNAVTFYGNNGYSQTWIDHVSCSVHLDKMLLTFVY